MKKEPFIGLKEEDTKQPFIGWKEIDERMSHKYVLLLLILSETKEKFTKKINWIYSLVRVRGKRQ